MFHSSAQVPVCALTHQAGYRVEIQVLNRLVRKAYPALFSGKKQLAGDVTQSLSQLAPKWFISLCVDTVALEQTLLIWDAFFTYGGLVGVYPVILGTHPRLMIRVSLRTSTGSSYRSDQESRIRSRGMVYRAQEASAQSGGH